MTAKGQPRRILTGNDTEPFARLVRWAGSLGVGILIFLVASLVIEFTRGSGRVAAIWPVNAMLIVILLKSPARNWLSQLLAMTGGLLAANIYAGDGLVRGTILALANLAEVCCVAFAFLRWKNVRFISLTGISILIFASFAGCFLSASLAALGLMVTGDSLYLSDATLWFAADFLGIVLFTPVFWSLIDRSRKFEIASPDVQFILKLGLLCVTTFFVFAQSEYPFLFLVPPALVYVAFSGGVKAAAIGLLMITAISLPFTLAGTGPISLMSTEMTAKILALQLFLATNSVLGLAVGAAASDRRRLVNQIKTSRARLRMKSQQQLEMIRKANLAERLAGVGHWTLNPETQQVDWSPEVYAIHGVTPEEFDPMYGDAIMFYAEGDRDRVRSLVQRGISQAEGWEFQATLIRRSDGKRRTVRSIGEVQTDSNGTVDRVFGVFRDITDEQNILEALASSESKYRTLADYSTDIIVRFGPDGVIRYASPACEILGVSPEDAVGLSTVDFTIPEDREHAEHLTDDLFHTSAVDPAALREFRVRNKDGDIIWLEGNPNVILDEHGNTKEVISTFRDVTERKAREKALAEARSAAEAAGKAKAEFLSNMSHEIRTPLNGILGFAQLLEQTDLSDEQRLFVERSLSAGRHLREIVDDILDYSKIEAGRVELEERPVDIPKLVRETVDLVRAAQPDTKVEFELDVEPLHTMADEVRIKQILTNLVGNAAKFTQEGSVAVNSSVQDTTLTIEVVDTGPGIAPEKLEHVFEGFRQADNSITRKFGGTGLGLSISRSLARLMGGDLVLESRVGEGTTARLILPARLVAPPETSQSDAEPDTHAGALKVMAVDDVPMNLELVAFGLGRQGHTVATFSSARAALDDLNAGNRYDVILMDVQMPDMDGLAATREIRSMSGPVAQTPIIALTANVLPEQIKECLQAGMTGHAPKPINIDELEKTVRRHGRSGNDVAESMDTATSVDALTARYADYLAGVPGELSKILQQADHASVLEDIRRLSHAIAGSAGSFGFGEVSDAAFALEAVAERIQETGESLEDLAPSVSRFIDSAEKAVA